MVCEARILETPDFRMFESSPGRKTHLVWLHLIFLLFLTLFSSNLEFIFSFLILSDPCFSWTEHVKTLGLEMHRHPLLLQGQAKENSNSTLIYCNNSVIKTLICFAKSPESNIFELIKTYFLRTKTIWLVLICAFPWFTSFEQPQKWASLVGCLQAVCGLKPWPRSAPKPELEPAVRPTTSPCCV